MEERAFVPPHLPEIAAIIEVGERLQRLIAGFRPVEGPAQRLLVLTVPAQERFHLHEPGVVFETRGRCHSPTVSRNSVPEQPPRLTHTR
jgi:hypothetical protein